MKRKKDKNDGLMGAVEERWRREGRNDLLTVVAVVLMVLTALVLIIGLAA